MDTGQPSTSSVVPDATGRARPLTETSTFPAAPSSSQIRRPRSEALSPSTSVFSAITGPVADPPWAEIQQLPRLAVIVTSRSFFAAAARLETGFRTGGGGAGGGGGGGAGGGKAGVGAGGEAAACMTASSPKCPVQSRAA